MLGVEAILPEDGHSSSRGVAPRFSSSSFDNDLSTEDSTDDVLGRDNDAYTAVVDMNESIFGYRSRNGKSLLVLASLDK